MYCTYKRGATEHSEQRHSPGKTRAAAVRAIGLVVLFTAAWPSGDWVSCPQACPPLGGPPPTPARPGGAASGECSLV